MSQPQREPNTYRQHRYTPPPGATEILLVRHGESQPVDPERPFDLVDGHGDPLLDPVGVDQAERLADRLAGEDIAAIYVTTLRRTVETAAPLAKRSTSAVLTWNDPLTSRLAWGPKTTPLGLSR